MNFGHIHSASMVMPNGWNRVVQFNVNTNTCGWVVVKNGRQYRITGKYHEIDTKVYFVPNKPEDCVWIKNFYKAQRTRFPTATTKEEYLSQQAILHNIRFEQKEAQKAARAA